MSGHPWLALHPWCPVLFIKINKWGDFSGEVNYLKTDNVRNAMCLWQYISDLGQCLQVVNGQNMAHFLEHCNQLMKDHLNTFNHTMELQKGLSNIKSAYHVTVHSVEKETNNQELSSVFGRISQSRNLLPIKFLVLTKYCIISHT